MKFDLAEREAENFAENLIVELNIETLPVCPFTIAKDRGIAVQPKESDKPGVSGFLMRVGDTFGILYASHIKNDGFIRFTISHELGHYFIPGHCDILFRNGTSLHESRSGYLSRDPCERQADIFAATLLMPATLFVKAIRHAGSGFQAIEALAQTCRTSITSTALRYARLAEVPVAVIVSKGPNVDYCFISDSLSEVRGLRRLSKGSRLPPNSLTARFNNNSLNVTNSYKNGAYTQLNRWFEDAPDGIEMKEDVVGLGTYGRTLTVLFTDDALPDEDDDDSGDDD